LFCKTQELLFNTNTSVILTILEYFKKRLKPVYSRTVSGKYDIIGDVHGYASELKALLSKLGYTLDRNGSWSHPERKAVFVGDLVSRGPDTRGVLDLVRKMVETNNGYTILGNHELNLIGYFTKNSKGNPLLEPAPSNLAQLERIRDQYKIADELYDHVKWLRRQPFFLDFGAIRVVHAFWSDTHKSTIEETITEGKLTKSLLKEIFKEETEFSRAIKQTTRGIELNLPNDLIIKDNKNVRRTNFRIKWWEPPVGKTFREISFGNRFMLPDYTVPQQIITPYTVYDLTKPVVFFGHYCAAGNKLIAAPNVCCVDGCIAGGKRLVAYRWSGETQLSENKFVHQERIV
jgi:hypothetical protein